MHKLISCARLLLVVLTCYACGCAAREYTASGHPSIVKFSSDSQRILYDDYRYDRVYLYHTGAAQMEVFTGGIGCVRSGVKGFVLLPWRLNDYSQSRVPITCLLATVENGKTALEVLESLPPGRLLSMFFYTDWPAIQAEMCQSPASTTVKGWKVVVNRLDGRGWSEGAYPCTMQTMHEQRGRPVGIMSEGCAYKYTPVDPGQDVECIRGSGANESEVRLLSPSAEFLVRIADQDDPLHRLTLTDLRTNKKVILLDKDDAERDAQEERERKFQYPIMRFLLFLHGRSGS